LDLAIRFEYHHHQLDRISSRHRSYHGHFLPFFRQQEQVWSVERHFARARQRLWNFDNLDTFRSHNVEFERRTELWFSDPNLDLSI
jgi:hypothetical protein